MRIGAKIILDTNIWVSYIIGRKLDEISKLILYQNLIIFSCKELDNELEEVLAREKFIKFLQFKPDIYVNFIRSITTSIPISLNFQECPDYKDNFLFDLAIQSDSEYLVTGDKLLLGMEVKNLMIISFKQFRQLFAN
jgi:uncharacterized protein